MATKIVPLFGGGESNKGLATEITQGIFRENAYLEEIKLYQTLESLKIYYAGIDLPKEIYAERIHAAIISDANYYQNEQLRINAMVANILKVSGQQFPSGGICIVSTGSNHSNRLGANLLHHYKTHAQNDAVNIQVFNYSSDYVKDTQIDREAALKLTESVDSPEIKQIYESLSCQSIEEDKHDKQFSIPVLEQFVDNLIHQNRPQCKEVSGHTSLFAPLTPHDQLLREFKQYINKYPKTNGDLMNLIIEKQYSLFLRKVCNTGNAQLVKLLLKYDGLAINFNECSSNGNTALAWFEQSEATLGEKMAIVILLKEKMGHTNSSENILK